MLLLELIVVIVDGVEIVFNRASLVINANSTVSVPD